MYCKHVIFSEYDVWQILNVLLFSMVLIDASFLLKQSHADTSVVATYRCKFYNLLDLTKNVLKGKL